MNQNNKHGITLVNVHHRKPYDIYIGRKPKGVTPNIWENPFPVLSGTDQTRDVVVRRHMAHLLIQMLANKITVEMLLDLKGKTLACFCANQDGTTQNCHGLNYIKMLDYLDRHDITTHTQFLIHFTDCKELDTLEG